ncbi:MAG: hypothetical protein J7L32_04165 [Thermoplasmata archaeon]|nr:MAG: hypothetical protein FE035_01105 [Thermoplasmata archaeon]MCD6468488.1 hypothetical protein [Thermoplasmata archaeon]RLF25984.1 MAG: hypothetical protein DRN01_05740 [Thermoplasmata archaeon]
MEKMGCESDMLSRVKLDYIQDFEMMFGRLKLDRPREAAAYYVTLVVDNPKEFSDFLRVAEQLANITRRPLETGRACLFKNGLIAKVLFTSEPGEEDFGRERYLPVNPRVIWEETKDDLKTIISEDTFAAMERHLEDISSAYNENFKTYGIKLKRNGNVTLQYNAKWILYTILSNCLEKSNHLRVQIGGEKLFSEPFVQYFRRFLELNNRVQLIVENEDHLADVKKLKEEFQEKLDVRYFPGEISGLMRNYMFGKELAVTSMKILSEGEDETSYIGTAYVDVENIEELNQKFESLWNLGKPL